MRRLLIAGSLLLLVACGGGKQEASTEPSPTPDPMAYLSHRGQIMPLHQAIGGVAFRPFIPSRVILVTALLPPYNGGDDTRANRGIAFEYMSHHQPYVLSEWPGAAMPGPRSLGTVNDCDLTGYDVNGGKEGKQGVLWSNGLTVSNLVAAGDATNRATFDEARRLARMGACR